MSAASWSAAASTRQRSSRARKIISEIAARRPAMATAVRTSGSV
jgi:hypothetical protein